MKNEIVDYDSAKSIIRRDLESMSRKFITIGYYLKLIRDNEMYHQDGFRDIWEFAQNTYGISKSTCSRWMAMNDKFSQGGNSPYLKEEYQDFGKSQLQEMLYLTDEQMEQARPDMTAKEIREIRKPEAPKIELKKPDETERQYLKSAAKHFIVYWHDWFLQDFMNRVMQAERSPKEIKKKIEGKSRSFYFSTDNGIGHINLFDGYVQVWNEENNYIGDFDWFYMAAAIQSMWNIVAIENAQKNQKESIAPSQQEEAKEEQIQGQMEIQDYPEVLPENKTGKCLHREEMLCSLSEKGKRTPGNEEDCNEKCCWECPQHGACKIECVASSSRKQREAVAVAQLEETAQQSYMNPPENPEEKVEITDSTNQEEKKFEELSEKTDMEIIRDLLDTAQKLLQDMRAGYTENDIRVRKQKLIIAAYAGMIADIENTDIPEPIRPELPQFKNNDQRKEWLRNYQAWNLWYEDKNIGARYYKYDFDNGARLIAEEYTRPATDWYEEHAISYLHLVGGPEPPKDKSGHIPKWNRHEIYDKFPNNETELVEFLKYIQKEQKNG